MAKKVLFIWKLLEQCCLQTKYTNWQFGNKKKISLIVIRVNYENVLREQQLTETQDCYVVSILYRHKYKVNAFYNNNNKITCDFRNKISKNK